MRVGVTALAAAFVLWLCAFGAQAEDHRFGDLDFTRMTKPQEEFFWKRLKILAFEEAILTYCGRPDDFERAASQGIQSCVSEQALSQARSFYRTNLKTSLQDIGARKLACDPKSTVTRGWLGVKMRPAESRAAPGVVVDSALDDSPASAADIRAGDVITSLNGENVVGPKELAAKILRFAPGATVQLGVMRDGAGRTLSVKLGATAVDRQGNAAPDMPAIIESSKKDLKYVADEVTDMCQKCKTSIWAVFCH